MNIFKRLINYICHELGLAPVCSDNGTRITPKDIINTTSSVNIIRLCKAHHDSPRGVRLMHNGERIADIKSFSISKDPIDITVDGFDAEQLFSGDQIRKLDGSIARLSKASRTNLKARCDTCGSTKDVAPNFTDEDDYNVIYSSCLDCRDEAHEHE